MKPMSNIGHCCCCFKRFDGTVRPSAEYPMCCEECGEKDSEDGQDIQFESWDKPGADMEMD